MRVSFDGTTGELRVYINDGRVEFAIVRPGESHIFVSITCYDARDLARMLTMFADDLEEFD